MAVKKKRSANARASKKKAAPQKKAAPRKKAPAFLTTRQFNALVKQARNQRRRRQGAAVATATLATGPAIDLSQGFDPVGDE